MIVAGFGFRHGASAASLQDAYDRARGASHATHLATAQDKAATPAFRAFAQTLALPVQAIAPDRLSAQTTLTQSTASYAAYATGSVAEAAALAAAGPDARLIAPRVVSSDRMATCALAQRNPS